MRTSIETIRHLQAARDSLDALLTRLQEDLQSVSVPVLDDPRLTRLHTLAKTKLVRADGEWVNWRDLRPAHRDRDQYAERLWSSLAADPEIEVWESGWGSVGFRREARYEPLI